jgi:hypothetical protein
MQPADVPILIERLKEQNERDGTSYALPQVFDNDGRRLQRIPLALVAADIETHEAIQGHIWETTLEHMAIGIEPGATISSIREQDAVWFLLRQRGFKDEHMLIPHTSAPLMESGLAKKLGMIDTGKVLKHFYRLLDPAENAELQDWYRKQEEKENVASPAGTSL